MRRIAATAQSRRPPKRTIDARSPFTRRCATAQWITPVSCGCRFTRAPQTPIPEATKK
jgi:hypothetical protein